MSQTNKLVNETTQNQLDDYLNTLFSDASNLNLFLDALSYGLKENAEPIAIVLEGPSSSGKTEFCRILQNIPFLAVAGFGTINIKTNPSLNYCNKITTFSGTNYSPEKKVYIFEDHDDIINKNKIIFIRNGPRIMYSLNFQKVIMVAESKYFNRDECEKVRTVVIHFTQNFQFDEYFCDLHEERAQRFAMALLCKAVRNKQTMTTKDEIVGRIEGKVGMKCGKRPDF